MSVENEVQAIANVFEEAEENARAAKADFRACRKYLEIIRDQGVIGGQECQMWAGRMDALITQYEADLWELHRAMTIRADDLGIDLPQPRSGGR